MNNLEVLDEPPPSLHPVDDFWLKLSECDCYPHDVTPVTERLPGTAAFAAGAGLWRPPGTDDLPDFPYGGLMVLGHNLDTETGYRNALDAGVSHGDPSVPGHRMMSTWAGPYKLLDRAGVKRTDFFFTNVFVGLMKGDSNVGKFTRQANAEYTAWRRQFLAYQVDVMRPRAVLVLGTHACNDVAEIVSPSPWPRGKLPPPTPIIGRLFDWETTLVPAFHTSYQKRLAQDAATLQTAWGSTGAPT